MNKPAPIFSRGYVTLQVILLHFIGGWIMLLEGILNILTLGMVDFNFYDAWLVFTLRQMMKGK